MSYDTTYQPAVRCVGGERPGARALQDFLLERIGELPGCTVVDSGIYNCRKIRGSKVRYSTHAEGRAGDVGVRLPDGQWPTREIPEPGIRAWADRLIDASSDLGIQYVIYAEKARKPGGSWERYRGTSPHYDHIHWEMTREAAEQVTASDIVRVFGESTSTGEQPMTITEYIEWRYWTFQDQHLKPDHGGRMFWTGEFADEKGSAAWSKNDYLTSATDRRMVYPWQAGTQ